MSIRGVVFAHARHGICRTERVLTCHHDVTVGRNREIQRAEVWIAHEAKGPGTLAGRERDNRVVALAIGPYPRREKQPSIVTKGKAARKWNDSRRYEMLSGRIE